MGVRKLIKQDREQISEILNILKSKHIFKQSEVECALELIDIYLAQEDDYECFSCVNEADVDVVSGYVCFGKTPLTDAVYDLYWIVVDSDCHRQGVGSQLMRFVEQDLQARDGRKLLVETSSLPVYDATRNFYLALGYEEAARIKDFYSLGDDKVVFEKDFICKI